MNNAAVVALFGHIALDGTPQRPAPETLQSLWKPFGGLREEKEGILSEFKECLCRAFSIDINNDLPDIHPVSLCYSCKQIMDRPMTCYSSTAITEWEVHAEDMQMHGININIIVGLYYMHVFLMHRYVIPKEVLSQHHHIG